jgi:hypothetical protein
LLLIAFAAIGALVLTLWLTSPAGADESPSANPLPQPQGVSNASCLECHGQPGLTLPLENGETMEMYVEQETFENSVHGAAGYACVQCHTDLEGYPHPEFTAKDVRDVALQLYETCRRCHAQEYERTLDSAHEAARQAGNRLAAICTDCHGAHDTVRLTDRETHELLPRARLWIPKTCSKCHSAIFDVYLTSVHGAALTQERNLDVPTCIDCHGVHDIEDPTTTAFRLASPELCAGCHSDPELMAKYGLSTQVLETYVADFHGTTVTLFEKQTPDAETNKPVCYDCHGVHNIWPVDDPQKGLQYKENLLSRCQLCHPDATANFPDAWLSHYIPSPKHSPLTYYVDLFYKIFIPGLLGGMGVLVLLDLNKLLRKRFASPGRGEGGEHSQSPRESSSATSPGKSDTSSSKPMRKNVPRDDEGIEPGMEPRHD